MSTDSSKVQPSIRRRFVGNTGWLVGQQIYTMGLQLVVGVLSARFLGPQNYGVITYGASLVAFFASVSQLGLSEVLLTDLVREKNDAGELMGSALFLRCMASIFSIFLIQLIVWILHPNDPLIQIVTNLQAISLIFMVYELINAWFQTKLWSKYSSLATMIAATVVSAWRILLLATKADVQLFALSSSIQALVCLFVVCVVFVRKKGFSLKLSGKVMRNLFARSKHVMFAGIAITIYLQSDKLMLGNMVGQSAVGIYNSASNLAHAWVFVPLALISSARPIIIGQKEKDEERYRKMVRMLLLGVFVLGAFVAAAFTILSPWIIEFLYGRAYHEAIPVLCLLSWACMFSALGSARSVWLFAEDGYRYLRDFSVIGALLNVVLNYVLIRVLGVSGAALATLLTEGIVFLVLPSFFYGTKGFLKLFVSSFSLTGEGFRMMKKAAQSALRRIK